jgi:thiol-disulfide isomerase/thioredoxin
MKRTFILFLLLTQMVLSISAQNADSLYSKSFLAPGTEAPDFTLMTPTGRSFELSSQRGRYVVIDFWASWCGDCRKIKPKMDFLSNAYSIDSVVFVGVSYDTDNEIWKNYVQSDNKDFIIHVSELKKWEETETSQQYGIKWIPTMYLIDPEGKVVMATTDVEKLAKALKNIDKSKITSEKQNREEIFNLMDITFPKYKGGKSALVKYLSSKIKYPKSCELIGSTGKVFVQFVVGKTGTLDSVSVIKTQVKINPNLIGVQLNEEELKMIEQQCKIHFEAEAVRVVRHMKNWIPALRYNHPICVKFTLPVRFKLQ